MGGVRLSAGLVIRKRVWFCKNVGAREVGGGGGGLRVWCGAGVVTRDRAHGAEVAVLHLRWGVERALVRRLARVPTGGAASRRLPTSTRSRCAALARVALFSLMRVLPSRSQINFFDGLRSAKKHPVGLSLPLQLPRPPPPPVSKRERAKEEAFAKTHSLRTR